MMLIYFWDPKLFLGSVAKHNLTSQVIFCYNELILDSVSKYITRALVAYIVPLSADYFFVTWSRFSNNLIN